MNKKIIFSVLVFAAALSFASGVAAHEGDEAHAQLKAEFRAAISADPRSASMSEAELDAMVEALAGEAQAQNVETEFVLPPLPTFAEAEEYFSTIETPWGQPITPMLLYSIVLASLLLAIALLWWMSHLHHSKIPEQM